ncbi:hypothetical protein KDK95_15140 [Actinospica sp. MGRD01-02]|uniref:Uncharacterized protein n=1 Tax=Actinospica acidithermotolerans TaxID=2828514 RepID=A0A941IJA2_9ACTN|nr:DUF6585 family protein [Actinospica acidithermotolerans]MBR7827652.1 hypothetical protein [Actinospica acidithermotolerans]
MADPVPAQVATAAQTLGLGELREVHNGPSNAVYVFLWWGYAFIVGGPGFVMLSPSANLFGHGSAVGKVITILIGVVLVGGAAAMVWRGLRIIVNRKLYLYPGGIVYTHPSGRAKWYGAWQDVQVYWGQGAARGSEQYRIVFPQGGRVRWGVKTRYQDVMAERNGVGAQARRLSTAHVLPLMLDRFRAGEMLEFGPLHIDRKGLIYERLDVAWPEVTSVTVLGRIALIFHLTEKRRFSVKLGKIPDLNVLLRLIEIARSSR